MPLVTTPFRTTPNLGPGLKSTSASNFWDTLRPVGADPTYQPGTTVTGNDGHLYVYVKAHAALAANAAVTINETTWASAAGAGYKAPVAVAIGDYFHARKDAI